VVRKMEKFVKDEVATIMWGDYYLGAMIIIFKGTREKYRLFRRKEPHSLLAGANA